MSDGVSSPWRPDEDAGHFAAAEHAARRQRRSERLAALLLVPLALLLVGLVLVFFVFFESSTVSGDSMLPTLRDHDYVLATRGLDVPKRGDIVILNVVFKGRPEEWVKRIVAVEGDKVDVAGDIILVNGQAEQFHHKILTTGGTLPVLHLTVPPGDIFIAGDNRAVSEDSRYVGTFPATSIRGKVVAIYAPISRIGSVPNP